MRPPLHSLKVALAALIALAPGAVLAAQGPVDHADPAVIREEAVRPETRSDAHAKIPVMAETANAGVGLDAGILAGAIRVDGAMALPPAAFAPVISSYVGRTLSGADLRKLASDIAGVARAAGYGLASAWIPRQSVTNGILQVKIEEGRIDAIDAKGDASDVARRMLAILVDGRPVRTAALERQLLLAGDVAGIWVGNARLERDAGRNVLVVQTRRDRIQARASIDNWGSGTIGPGEAQLSIDFNGLLSKTDQLTVTGFGIPLHPKEFVLGEAKYSRTLGSGGTEISIDGYVARSKAGGALADRGFEGRASQASLAASHAFIRSRAASLWGDISFTLRDSEQSRQGAKIRDDRFALVTAIATGNVKLGAGRIRGTLSIVQGLGLLDATRGGDPLASRDDGSAIFTELDLWAQYSRPLGDRFSVQLATEGQLASRPLLSSEEMGLGGRSFLRGYDYREFSGDKGIAASAELRFDLGKLFKPISAAQLYGYADAGSVGNYRGGRGGGTLASAGGGARIWLSSKVQAGLELGFPLRKGFDRTSHRDPRLSFTIGARF